MERSSLRSPLVLLGDSVSFIAREGSKKEVIGVLWHFLAPLGKKKYKSVCRCLAHSLTWWPCSLSLDIESKWLWIKGGWRKKLAEKKSRGKRMENGTNGTGGELWASSMKLQKLLVSSWLSWCCASLLTSNSFIAQWLGRPIWNSQFQNVRETLEKRQIVCGRTKR